MRSDVLDVLASGDRIADVVLEEQARHGHGATAFELAYAGIVAVVDRMARAGDLSRESPEIDALETALAQLGARVRARRALASTSPPSPLSPSPSQDAADPRVDALERDLEIERQLVKNAERGRQRALDERDRAERETERLRGILVRARHHIGQDEHAAAYVVLCGNGLDELNGADLLRGERDAARAALRELRAGLGMDDNPRRAAIAKADETIAAWDREARRIRDALEQP